MENNKKEEDRRFYVYEHIRKDNNTCFYVGKGTRDRAYNLDRGDFHNGVCKEYGCRVKIIKDGLTEKEAFALERERIEDYVITFGYGIPIDGYRDYSNNYLTNFTWGGEGVSGLNAYANKTPEEMEIIANKKSNSMKGKNNGKNPYANKTEEEMKTISKKKSEAMKGQKNPMYGKNSFANKTEEEMKIILEKKSKSMKGKMTGRNHPMYCKPAPNKRKVICVTTGRIFDCIKDAEKHYKCSNVSYCCTGKRNYAGKLNGKRLKWMYLEDYNNEFKGILINPIINK